MDDPVVNNSRVLSNFRMWVEKQLSTRCQNGLPAGKYCQNIHQYYHLIVIPYSRKKQRKSNLILKSLKIKQELKIISTPKYLKTLCLKH